METILFEGPVSLTELELLAAGEHDGSSHNLLFVHEIQGPLEPALLDRALRWLAERHEGFRTSFVRVGGEWRRRVHRSTPLTLEVVDLSSREDPEAEARSMALALGARAMDRGQPLLIQPRLFRLGEGRFWWVSYGDHVVLDGTSFGTCMAELLGAYLEIVRTGAAPLLPAAVQPREHFARLEASLAPLREAPGAWLRKEPPDGFPLRPDASRPGGLDPAGGRLPMMLGDTGALDDFSRARGVSRGAPMLVAVALGLSELAGRPDVAFTTIRSGRRGAGAQGVVGCLAWGDSFPVRVEGTLGAMLERADAFLRDDEPWRMLYIPMAAPASGRIVVNINRFPMGLNFPGFVTFLRPDVLPEVRMWRAHDLLLQLFPMPGALHGVARYRASMFEPATMARLGETMGRTLAALLADPSTPAGAIVGR